MSRKWEHLMEPAPQQHIQALLDRRGAEGWELIAAVQCGFVHHLTGETHPGVQCFFKRPAPALVDLRESVDVTPR